MKKLVTYMFAAMLFVPTFAGCAGGSDEAEIQEDDGSSALGDVSEEDYESQIQKSEEQAKQEAQ